jgi:hypothetical protein
VTHAAYLSPYYLARFKFGLFPSFSDEFRCQPKPVPFGWQRRPRRVAAVADDSGGARDHRLLLARLLLHLVVSQERRRIDPVVRVDLASVPGTRSRILRQRWSGTVNSSIPSPSRTTASWTSLPASSRGPRPKARNGRKKESPGWPRKQSLFKVFRVSRIHFSFLGLLRDSRRG